MPFKVLIAEDEPIVSHFIEQIISPMQKLEVLTVCVSGEEACRYITPTEPHVLLTDIQMHGISGLELIRRAKKIKPDIRVIIISGYSLFEYAKEAIKLGIDDYLLKPIDPAELCACLQSIENSLIEQYNEKKNQSLKAILRNGSYEKIQALYADCDLELMVVSQSGEVDATLEYCLEAVAHNPCDHANVALFNRSVLLIAPKEDNSNGSWLPSVGKWLLDHCHSKTFSIISTAAPVSAAQLPQVLTELYTVSQEERIFGQQIWLRWSAAGNTRRYSKRCNREIPKDLLSGNLSKAEVGYSDFFLSMSQHRYTVLEVRASIYALMDELRTAFVFSESMPAVNDSLAEALKYADSFAEARDSTWAIIHQSIKQTWKTQADTRIDLKQLYETVSQYLRENCANNDSLQQIANRFHVSQPYISRAFREYANMSYKEFCMNLKIEIARKLIQTRPDMMFKDVATYVGIEPSYFSTVFHRLTEEYPSEYKARIETEN